jgi:UDP-glucose:glycoprotein glucosyltransferase
VLGNASAPVSVLYADITSTTFPQFHKTLVNAAREGKSSYRLRHRPSLSSVSEPLVINGYGVELALKRTDYIVIDDRDKDDVKNEQIIQANEVNLENEELADLKPLSTSELFSLSVQAASYVMQSEDPFETLLKVSQDFPKYSAALAARNASKEFLTEHQANRAQLVPAGMNLFWINGVQIAEREVDPFVLLDHLRKERKLIDGVRDLGLTGPEAVELLAHEEVANVKALDEPQRFNWRDVEEGGDVIIWLNDIEKDKRYQQWPVELKAVSFAYTSPDSR